MLAARNYCCTTIGVGAGVMFCSLGGLLQLLLSQYRALLRSEASLADRSRDLEGANLKFDTAINNVAHGLCMYDAAHRLVVCNESYAKLYRLPPALLVPGTPHRDILVHHVRSGILKGPAEAHDLGPHLPASPGCDGSSQIDAHADRRLIRVTHKPMPGGGRVGTYEDLTAQPRAECDVRETKRFLHLIIESITIAIAVKDPDTRRPVLGKRAFGDGRRRMTWRLGSAAQLAHNRRLSGLMRRRRGFPHGKTTEQFNHLLV
jgi:PAS domain-containing protein